MNKLASLTGYTPGSAAFTMGKIKRKLKNKTAGITTDNPAAKSRQGRPRASTATSTPAKKRGATATSATSTTKRARKPANQPPSPTPEDVFAADNDDDDDDDDFNGLDDTKVKVKKEEPGFDQGSGFYRESGEKRDGGGGGENYGFLDGIETFCGGGGGGAAAAAAAVGGGRSAATGYRKLAVEDAE